MQLFIARGDEIDRSDHIKNEACFNKNNMKHRSEHEKDNDIQCQSLMLPSKFKERNM